MIAVIDCGIGNTGSILSMIKKVGGSGVLCKGPEQLKSASGIVFPGVGSFDNGMRKLKASGCLEIMEYLVLEKKTPFLGICLGMQLLFQDSEEGVEQGLGWVSGNVRRFEFSNLDRVSEFKVPHMGWNLVQPTQDSSHFAGLSSGSRFYFVHSYHVVCEEETTAQAVTNYGYDFTSAIGVGNIWGAQFHPEKSHRFGMQYFRNFVNEVALCSGRE